MLLMLTQGSAACFGLPWFAPPVSSFHLETANVRAAMLWLVRALQDLVLSELNMR